MEDEIYNSPITIPNQPDSFKGNKKDFDDFKSILKERGVEGFNNWARENDRYGLDLRGIRLSNLDLHRINLKKARLDRARLLKVNFNEAILAGISMDNSKITDVNFENSEMIDACIQNSKINGGSMANANLYGAHLKKTKLIDTDMSYTNLNGADLKAATLDNIKVTGTSAWAVDIDSETKQSNLKIVPFFYPFQKVLYEGDDSIVITCNDIETAQLLYLLTRRNEKDRSEKVRQVIDSVTDKIVLILGNFRRDRKLTLKKIRQKLSEMNYVPVIFDFSVPKNRDMVETVAILAGLSRFVIADFTSQSSIPLESMLIIPGYKVPFKPVVKKGYKIFAMFSDLRGKYDWVLDKWEYKDNNDLLKGIKRNIIEPCERKCKEYNARKARLEKLRIKKLKRK
jgi:hypothetical protein